MNKHPISWEILDAELFTFCIFRKAIDILLDAMENRDDEQTVSILYFVNVADCLALSIKFLPSAWLSLRFGMNVCVYN